MGRDFGVSADHLAIFVGGGLLLIVLVASWSAISAIALVVLVGLLAWEAAQLAGGSKISNIDPHGQLGVAGTGVVGLLMFVGLMIHITHPGFANIAGLLLSGVLVAATVLRLRGIDGLPRQPGWIPSTPGAGTSVTVSDMRENQPPDAPASPSEIRPRSPGSGALWLGATSDPPRDPPSSKASGSGSGIDSVNIPEPPPRRETSTPTGGLGGPTGPTQPPVSDEASKRHRVIWTHGKLAALTELIAGRLTFDKAGVHRRGQQLAAWTDVGWIEVEDKLLTGRAVQQTAQTRAMGVQRVQRHRYTLRIVSPQGTTILSVARIALPRVAGSMYHELRQAKKTETNTPLPPETCERCGTRLGNSPLHSESQDGLVGVYVAPGVASGMLARSRQGFTLVDQAALCLKCQRDIQGQFSAQGPVATAPNVLVLSSYSPSLRAQVHQHLPWNGSNQPQQSRVSTQGAPNATVLIPSGAPASRPHFAWLSGMGDGYELTLRVPSHLSGIVEARKRVNLEIVAQGDRLLTPDGFDTPTFGEEEIPNTIAVVRAREYWVRTFLPAGSYVIRRQASQRGLISRLLAASSSVSQLVVVQALTAVTVGGLTAYEECDTAYRKFRRGRHVRSMMTGAMVPLLPAIGCLMFPLLILWRIYRLFAWIVRAIIFLAVAAFGMIYRAIQGQNPLDFAYNDRGIYRGVDCGFVLWRAWSEMSDSRIGSFFARMRERSDPEQRLLAVKRAADMLLGEGRAEDAQAVLRFARGIHADSA